VEGETVPTPAECRQLSSALEFGFSCRGLYSLSAGACEWRGEPAGQVKLMSRKRIVVIVAALVLCGVLFYFYLGHETPPGQPPLSELNPQNFTTIENAFNAAKTDGRILLLLSPT
jgi:hypothetical protein